MLIFINNNNKAAKKKENYISRKKNPKIKI